MLRPLLVVVVVSGCGAFKTPSTPAEQANAALATDGKKDSWIGHLDGSLTPVDGKELAFSAQGEKGLKFVGIADGHLCFAIEWKSQRINVSAKDFGDASVDAVRKIPFTFEARDALDYPKQAAWPAHPANQVQSVVLAENRSYDDHRTDSDGEVHTYNMLATRIELCGPAPSIGAATKFVTVTAFNPEKSVPSLYVWQIDSSVDNSLVGGATPSTPAVADDSAPAQSHHSHKDKANSQPPEDLMTRISSDGRFTTFLKLLAASDYADKLSEGKGTYTLFLPTDDVLAASGASWMKDPKKVNSAVHSHIFGGIKTKAQIVDGTSGKDGFVKLQNENGDYIKVTVENGVIHIGKKSTVVDPELAASNGVVYVINSSLY